MAVSGNAASLIRAGAVFSLVFFAVAVFAPSAHAASALRWNYLFDEGAGTVNPEAEIIMIEGGTYAVPFGVPGDVSIEATLPDEPYYYPAGELFFINSDTGERESLGQADYGLSWEQAGTYELDTYAQLIVPTRTLWDRFFAWFVPTAYAAIYGDYVETIRFTITEGPLPSAPCCSSVLFLPGIQGSVLKEGDNVRWPSSLLSQDVARLALTEDGDSIEPVVVDGIIDTFYTTQVYSGFSSFMNVLVDENTIRAWKPFAYDWRLPLQKTVDEGAFWESEGEVVELVATIEDLAQESKTGKVTIVAHSMGGLLGKTLIKRLEENGQAELIDNFVMVGTPQLGTPEALAALLHGHEPLEMELFMRSHVFRSIARNMESAYSLLPSEAYFNVSGIPAPITFNESADFTEEWRTVWGTEINTPTELREFLTGTGVIRTRPNENNLAQPEVLRDTLVENVEVFHTGLDSYEFPSHIRVVQVAGWGLPTIESIEYKKKHLIFDGYEPHFTVEGDQTVVYPSALTVVSDEKYFFNLATYNALDDEVDRQHRDLTSAPPVQAVINSVLRETTISNTYIKTSKPDPGDLADQLLVSTKSPVILGVYDIEGNFTGVNPDQDLDSEVLEISEDIPGSVFISSGEDQYIFLPKEGSYTFKFKGTGSGPATVETSTFSSDTVTPVATYTDIPVTLETEATFIINTEVPQETIIEVDANGDGTPETTVAPDGYVPPPPSEPTIAELIATLKTKIQSLDIKPKLKENLLKKVGKIELKIEKQKERKSRVLENLEAAIAKKAAKGKIDTMSAAEITALLEELEASVAVFPLDSVLIQELRGKITNLATTPKIKTNLLKRVDRLEKMTGLLISLERLTAVITTKGVKGKIPDADVQVLLDLLTEIEGGL